MFSKGKGTGGSGATDSAPVSGGEAPRQAQSERPRASIGGVPSIISADLTITGNLHSDGDIQIDGQVDGDVLSRSLTIGQGAKVKGTVRAEEVKIAGNLKGEVHASRVSITSTAKVNGDVLHKSLSIEAGAYIDGLCRRIEEPKAASASSSASASASSSPATASSSASASASPGAPKPASNGEAKSASGSNGGLNLEGKA